MQIREATLDDAAAVADLMGELDHPTSTDEAAERLGRVLADDSYDAWVAVDDDGEVVGITGVHLQWQLGADEPVARMLTLVVAPRARGADVGASLLHHAEARATERGATLFTIACGLQRHAAHDLYRSLGYTQTGLHFDRKLHGGD